MITEDIDTFIKNALRTSEVTLWLNAEAVALQLPLLQRLLETGARLSWISDNTVYSKPSEDFRRAWADFDAALLACGAVYNPKEPQ